MKKKKQPKWLPKAILMYKKKYDALGKSRKKKTKK